MVRGRAKFWSWCWQHERDDAWFQLLRKVADEAWQDGVCPVIRPSEAELTNEQMRDRLSRGDGRT